MSHTTRITRALLALILLLLAGCTGEEQQEKHIIVLWHAFTGVESQALQALTDQFNADNVLDIVLLTEYQQDIITKISSATIEHRPDLVILWPKDLQAYITAGLIGTTPNFAPAIRRERADLDRKSVV